MHFVRGYSTGKSRTYWQALRNLKKWLPPGGRDFTRLPRKEFDLKFTFAKPCLDRLIMASNAVASDSLVDAFKRYISPNLLPQSETGTYTTNELIKSSFPTIELSEAEKSIVNKWLITSSHIGSPDEDSAKSHERLSSLNTHLSTRTTILGSKPSLADVSIYASLAPVVSKWSPQERTGEKGFHHIVRHINFVQNAPSLGLNVDEANKVTINEDEIISPIKPIDPKIEKERKKREKEATAAATDAREAHSKVKENKSTRDESTEILGAAAPGAAKSDHRPVGKKEKKEKQPKQPQQAAKETPLSPSLIDLRVGHILKAERHPNADSLYVSTIACGDAPGTDNTSEYEGQVVRTVCSGLNGLIALEKMQNRKIVAVCNLKPVTMRGIKSAAMVLAGSPRLAEGEVDNHAGPVELVNPPATSKAGDRVFFVGWEGEPEAVLNPKKKIWESCQVGFTTTNSCEVAFDASKVSQLEGKDGVSLLRTKDGICKVDSLKDATVR